MENNHDLSQILQPKKLHVQPNCGSQNYRPKSQSVHSRAQQVAFHNYRVVTPQSQQRSLHSRSTCSAKYSPLR